MIAISSAFKNAMIAIDIDGKTKFCQLDSNAKHAESLLPAIDKMLGEMGCKIGENNSYCVVTGPGSFTGLRIGIALIKGLVQGQQGEKKIYPITSFDLMAYSYIKNNIINDNFTCVINALSGLYFVCSYDKSGNKIGPEQMIEKEELDKLQGIKVGLKEENITNIQIEVTPNELLELALLKEKQGEFCSYKELCPLYIRKSQAEAALDNKK